MLLFDQFKSEKDAADFVAKVKNDYGLEGAVYDNQEQSDAVDPFPFVLTAPIVLIPRTNPVKEQDIIVLAEQFCGSFAGT